MISPHSVRCILEIKKKKLTRQFVVLDQKRNYMENLDVREKLWTFAFVNQRRAPLCERKALLTSCEH